LDSSNLTRMTVAEAAVRLGVTQDAIRQRIRRDSIPHEKDESGRVYVYLDATSTDHDGVHDEHHDAVRDRVRDALIDELRKQNDFLRAELERKDTILLTMAQRIPELEPVTEAPQSPETAAGTGEGVETPLAAQKPSWFKRFFGIGV
jgi:excisionase family DNA binding protein